MDEFWEAELLGKPTAASTVQVILGSFIAEGKKSSSNNLKSGHSSTPSSQMLTSGASVTPTSPTFEGPSTESSDDNENNTFSKGPGLYNNASQPLHNMSMCHQLCFRFNNAEARYLHDDCSE